MPTAVQGQLSPFFSITQSDEHRHRDEFINVLSWGAAPLNQLGWRTYTIAIVTKLKYM